MRRFEWAALIAVLAGFGQPANAAEPGFYVGAGVGGSEHDLSNGSANGSIAFFLQEAVINVPRDSLESDGNDTGWRGLAGYRLGRYFAAELEYLNFGGGDLRETYTLSLDFLGDLTAEMNYSTDVSGPAVSALGILPIGDQFDLFLRAGVLFADAEVTAHEFRKTDTYGDEVFIGGAGANWRFLDRWAARLEYQRSADLDANFDIAESHVELLSLSILFSL